GPEVARRGRAVEAAEEAQGLAEVVLLAGGPAVLDVVGDDAAIPVGEDQLVDGRAGGKFRLIGRDRDGARGRVEVGDEAVISLPALPGVVLPEVVGLAANNDHAEVLRLVTAILGDAAAGHGCGLLPAESVTGNALLQPRKPHPPTRRGILSPGFG